MTSIGGVLGLAAIIAVNAVIAAICVRLLRVRLSTRLGVTVFVAVLVPVPLTVVVLVGSGLLGLGTDVGSRQMAVWTTILLPMGIGVAYDVFWMPPPEQVAARRRAD